VFGSAVCLLWTQGLFTFCTCLRYIRLRPLFFLGALAKLRKATVSFVVCVHLSVYPSVRTEQLDSHGADFHEIWFLSNFRKYVEKIKVYWKCDKNNGYFTWRPICVHFASYRPSFLLILTDDSNRTCREGQNPHLMFGIFFKKNSCCLWNNVEKNL